MSECRKVLWFYKEELQFLYIVYKESTIWIEQTREPLPGGNYSMELRIVALVFLFSSLNGELNKRHILQRRGLIQLAGTIQCGTGRSAVHYIGYGCHCGLGGQGVPKDNTDWCCHSHDCCYEFAEKYGCKTKLGQYSWTCKDNTVKCGDMKDWCQKIVCKCDSKFAECLSKTRFNSKHILYPNLLCKKRTPSCRSSKNWFSERE